MFLYCDNLKNNVLFGVKFCFIFISLGLKSLTTQPSAIEDYSDVRKCCRDWD